MNNARSTLMMLAAIVPRNILVEQVEEAIQNWKQEETKQTLNKLDIALISLSMNIACGGDIGKAQVLTSEMNEMEQDLSAMQEVKGFTAAIKEVKNQEETNPDKTSEE